MSIFLNETVLQAILPVYVRLSDEDLLKRCSLGKVQNANESLHSVIWELCPKENFVSKVRLEIAVAKAVSKFNMGAAETLKVLATVRQTVAPEVSMKINQSTDRKRLWMAEYKTTDDYKDKRVQKKFKFTNQISNQEKSEGITYKAGAF